MRLTLTALLALGSASCAPATKGTDYSNYRTAITKNLADPLSAQFRNERVRILWTKSGKRRTIYCAEINAKNLFGAYTGFSGAELIVATSGLRKDSPFRPGIAWVKFGPMEYYLDCDRADTERTDQGIEWITAEIKSTLTAENRAYVDQSFPVLSSEPAPR